MEIKMAEVFGSEGMKNLHLRGALVLTGPEADAAVLAVKNHDRLVEENKRLLEKLSDIHEYVSMIPLHLTDEKTHSNEHINHFVNQIKLLSELGGE